MGLFRRFTSFNLSGIFVFNKFSLILKHNEPITQALKIITWNCNMAFRKKAGSILAQQPDILVVPECEHPDKLKFEAGIPLPNDVVWFGANANKGLGVFSYSNFRFRLLDQHNPAFKTILPIAVTGGAVDFTLFAIWANHPQDKGFEYIGQVWKALQHYDNLLHPERTMLVGDFNSNSIWDKESRIHNHSAVVEHLRQKNIFSTYHLFCEQEQGKELKPTLYMYRHQDKPYHIDYCFASADFCAKLSSVEIGAHQDWASYSDHTPVMVRFDW